MLYPQFAHIGKIRAATRIGVGARQVWTVFSEEVHPKGHIVLRVLAQPVPPLAKFVRELDFPCYESIMYWYTYIVKGI